MWDLWAMNDFCAGQGQTDPTPRALATTWPVLCVFTSTCSTNLTQWALWSQAFHGYSGISQIMSFLFLKSCKSLSKLYFLLGIKLKFLTTSLKFYIIEHCLKLIFSALNYILCCWTHKPFPTSKSLQLLCPSPSGHILLSDKCTSSWSHLLGLTWVLIAL